MHTDGHKPPGKPTPGWKLAYWLLWAAFLLAASLNLLGVRGGFLTNHLADLSVPALLYVVSRGLASENGPPKLAPMRWIGRTPAIAALTWFAASAASEISQLYWPTGFFSGRFDPWDIVAYAAGLLPCYLFDKAQNRSEPARG